MTCDDSQGSFECLCVAGNFKDNGLSQNDKVCSDVDECAVEDNKCNVLHGKCNNTDGSFHCTCESGWTQNLDNKDAFECTDILECQSDATNPCDKVNGILNEVEGYL